MNRVTSPDTVFLAPSCGIIDVQHAISETQGKTLLGFLYSFIKH